MGISSECEVQIGSMATTHLETRELCLGPAWHCGVLSDSKSRVQRQPWPLYTNYWHSSLGSLMIHFLSIFSIMMTACQVIR